MLRRILFSFFKDDTLASYSEGFTNEIDKKFKLLEKLKYNEENGCPLEELRIINEYCIHGRCVDDQRFEHFWTRTTEFSGFELFVDSSYFCAATYNPFAVYVLRTDDMIPAKYTFSENGVPCEKYNSISDTLFPLENETIISIANYYSESSLLVAVDCGENELEFRIYNLLDPKSFIVVSEKITKGREEC